MQSKSGLARSQNVNPTGDMEELKRNSKEHHAIRDILRHGAEDTE